MGPSSQNTYVTELVSNVSYCTVLREGEPVEVQSWQVWMLCLRSIHFKMCGGRFQNSGQMVQQLSGSACVLQVTGGVLLQILRITYLLTYTMEQSPSWESNRFSASQEIPRILWNPKVHCRIHKCPAPVPILPEKLTGFQLVKKFPAFYETPRFIVAFTNALHEN